MEVTKNNDDKLNFLLIKKSEFDEYFDVLYKIEYGIFMENNFHKSMQNKKECICLLKQKIKQLSDKIKKIFDDAINSNNVIPIKKSYHRFVYTNSTTAKETKSSWIKTNNKLKLYRYLLFDCDLISTWMQNILFDETEYFDEVYVNGYYGINYVDLIGHELKKNIDSKMISIDHENEIEYIDFCKKIFDFNTNKVELINELQNSSFADKQCKKLNGLLHFVPKTYSVINDDLNFTEHIDIIELFDVFFSSNKGYEKFCDKFFSDYYTNILYLDSSDEIFIDLDC